MLLLYFYARHFAKKNFWILFFSHSQPRSLRPPHPFGNGTGPPERGGSLPPRDVNKYSTHDSRDKYMPSGFAQQDSEQISKPFSNNSSQSRQNNTAPTQRKCSLCCSKYYKFGIWMVDAKSTPSYSSDLHFSVLQNRPDRGALICSKICSKKFKVKKKGWKWHMPNIKVCQWCYMPVN